METMNICSLKVSDKDYTEIMKLNTKVQLFFTENFVIAIRQDIHCDGGLPYIPIAIPIAGGWNRAFEVFCNCITTILYTDRYDKIFTVPNGVRNALDVKHKDEIIRLVKARCSKWNEIKVMTM